MICCWLLLVTKSHLAFAFGGHKFSALVKTRIYLAVKISTRNNCLVFIMKTCAWWQAFWPHMHSDAFAWNDFEYRWVTLHPNTDNSKSQLIRSLLETINCISQGSNCMPKSKHFHLVLFVRIKPDPPVDSCEELSKSWAVSEGSCTKN